MKDESQTLTRGLQLLDLLAAGHEGKSVRDLAAAMGLARSIVQRLLNSLEAQGFIVHHPSKVGYRLSIKLWSLGCAAINGLGLTALAKPHLEVLSNETRETVKLSMLEGMEVVSVDSIETSQTVRAYLPIGGRAPAKLAATGRVIIAFQNASDAVPENIVIRKRGYAVNKGDWQPGVGAIAAPVFGADGAVIASIGVIMPLIRLKAMQIPRIGALCLAASLRISEAAGYRGGHVQDLYAKIG